MIASHTRQFNSAQTVYDWQHYIDLVQRKPGALRNGAAFLDLPAPLLRLRQMLLKREGGDRVMAQVQFERICANDLQLLPVEVMTFHRAAMLTMDAAAGLRAGDALHLACAMEAKAQGMVTLDVVLAKNAKRFKVKPVTI